MISAVGSIFRKKILIVHADPNIRSLYALGLNSERVDTFTAGNATEALSYLDQKIFDLIILDVRLRDYHGLEIVKQMRKRRDFARIIISSSNLSAKTVLNAVSLGVTNFIEKPTNMTQLRQIAKEALTEKNALKDRAFQLAQGLKFKDASRLLAENSVSNQELVTWQKVFQALAEGAEITPYSGDLMEVTLGY